MLSPYRSIGYPIYKVSAEDGRGLPELEQALANQTTILVGQSGVGKSSLLNKLNSSKLADVAPLSETWARGTHTTTTSFPVSYASIRSNRFALGFESSALGT